MRQLPAKQLFLPVAMKGGRQHVDKALGIGSREINGSNSMAVLPRGMFGVMHTRVTAPPEKFIACSLGPGNNGKILHPLLHGNGENVGMKRRLAQAEYGLDESTDVDHFSSRDAVKGNVIRMLAEIRLSSDIGDKVLSERLGSSIPVVCSCVGGVRTGISPTFGCFDFCPISFKVYGRKKYDMSTIIPQSYLADSHSRSSTRISRSTLYSYPTRL